MKGLILKVFLIITAVSVPALAQQGTIPSSHTESLSWGWLMALGLIAGMLIGVIVRPRKITDSDETDRHDRAA
jgi:hypothetical protein